MRNAGISIWFVLACLLAADTVKAERAGRGEPFPPGSVKFAMHRVGTFRSEACGVGDFNNDGKLDIVAGPYLYLAPDFTARKIRTLQGKVDDQGKGYNWDFMNAPLDVDGDGLLDVISCSWHGKRIEWYRNLGAADGEWPAILIEENGNYEHGDLWDIDGDGRRNEILPGITGTVWYEVGKTAEGKRGMIKHVVSEKRHDWGIGAATRAGAFSIGSFDTGASEIAR